VLSPPPPATYRAVAMVTEAVLPDRWAIDTSCANPRGGG
jgi:hypothetical protein